MHTMETGEKEKDSPQNESILWTAQRREGTLNERTNKRSRGDRRNEINAIHI